ncbi:hypothetical protein [Streptomyces cacaoi]|uniref:hypothetical protein n=1 Tax=Streptomyces cacaoi TaxID=1898 RepID=UPI00262D5CB4|nr:hypothetical protein [Streptomyces cacaoi]
MGKRNDARNEAANTGDTVQAQTVGGNVTTSSDNREQDHRGSTTTNHFNGGNVAYVNGDNHGGMHMTMNM